MRRIRGKPSIEHLKYFKLIVFFHCVESVQCSSVVRRQNRAMFNDQCRHESQGLTCIEREIIKLQLGYPIIN